MLPPSEKLLKYNTDEERIEALRKQGREGQRRRMSDPNYKAAVYKRIKERFESNPKLKAEKLKKDRERRHRNWEAYLKQAYGYNHKLNRKCSECGNIIMDSNKSGICSYCHAYKTEEERVFATRKRKNRDHMKLYYRHHDKYKAKLKERYKKYGSIIRAQNKKRYYDGKNDLTDAYIKNLIRSRLRGGLKNIPDEIIQERRELIILRDALVKTKEAVGKYV
jgi:hypothetical protein